MKKIQSKTYQLGAAHERQAIVRHLRRARKSFPEDASEQAAEVLDAIIGWIEKRTARFDAKPGGLQGKKKKTKFSAMVAGPANES